MTLSIIAHWVSLCWMSHFIYCYAECHYAECRVANCPEANVVPPFSPPCQNALGPRRSRRPCPWSSSTTPSETSKVVFVDEKANTLASAKKFFCIESSPSVRVPCYFPEHQLQIYKKKAHLSLVWAGFLSLNKLACLSLVSLSNDFATIEVIFVIE